jgi:hypothetical protein
VAAAYGDRPVEEKLIVTYRLLARHTERHARIDATPRMVTINFSARRARPSGELLSAAFRRTS